MNLIKFSLISIFILAIIILICLTFLLFIRYKLLNISTMSNIPKFFYFDNKQILQQCFTIFSIIFCILIILLTYLFPLYKIKSKNNNKDKINNK